MDLVLDPVGGGGLLGGVPRPQAAEARRVNHRRGARAGRRCPGPAARGRGEWPCRRHQPHPGRRRAHAGRERVEPSHVRQYADDIVTVSEADFARRRPPPARRSPACGGAHGRPAAGRAAAPPRRPTPSRHTVLVLTRRQR
ncbi:MAG: hypothetical protein WKG07_15365 [Hymenobacter sp.]